MSILESVLAWLRVRDLHSNFESEFVLATSVRTQVAQWTAKQDKLAVEKQRAELPAEHWAHKNMLDEGVPYAGATDGRLSYLFTPGADGFTLRVHHALTNADLAILRLPACRRSEPGAEHFVLDAAKSVQPWLHVQNRKALESWAGADKTMEPTAPPHRLGTLCNPWLEYRFTPTSIGTTSVVRHLVTCEELDTTQYDLW